MSDKKARPWDLFNHNIEKIDVNDEEFKKRISFCNSCEHLLKATRQCKKCGCFMDQKAKLPHADCPVGKWGKVIVPIDHII